MAFIFPWAKNFRRHLDKLHDEFVSRELGVPVEIVMRPGGFDKLRAAMIEVEDSNVQGLAGRLKLRAMVVFGRDARGEFFQYRGFRFSRERSDDSPSPCE